MKSQSKGKIRIWKDAPAALCEFVGVDPARKWAQCEKERDEWAALAGQYKSERDEAREENKKLREALEWIVERYENPMHTHRVAMDAYEMSCTARAALRMEEAK